MNKNKTSFLQLFLIWIVSSLFIQFSIYAILDYHVSKTLSPNPTDSFYATEIIVPATEITNPKLSNSRRLLAYSNNERLEIYDLTLNKVVYKRPSTDGRIIAYSWLPDRESLVFLYSSEIYIHDSPMYNSNATQLFTLEFSNNTEAPEERYSGLVKNFPENEVVKEIGISTFTNLMYLIFDHIDYSILMEIDVNKNTKVTSRSGETISNIAVSDKKGILYIESSISSTNKNILAVDGWKRYLIDDNPTDMLLGYQSGQLYLGTKDETILEEIKVITEKIGDNSFTNEHIIWKGHLSLANNIQAGIISSGKVAILSSTSLYIIDNGHLEEHILSGNQNYISQDAQVIIQLTKKSDFTTVKLIPIDTF